MNIFFGIIIVLAFILLQGFFAASEMSLVSLNRLRLHHLAERKDKKALLILGFLNKPEKFLSTTLVGQNLALIISSTLMNHLVYSVFQTYFSHFHKVETYIPLISTILVFPLIIIFGQIVPMSLSRLHNETLAKRFIIPLKFMSFVFYPFIFAFSKISLLIAGILGSSNRRRNPFVSREELRLLFREESELTDLDKKGRKMIHEIFDLQKTFAKDIMTPLIDIIAVPDNATAGDAIDIISKSGYSHIPVYHNRVDDITGVVHAYDLIDIRDRSQNIKAFMKSPYIVPETKPAYEILLEFRNNNKHIAFAVDEYGGVTGLLTMEDIIEEIVGDIEDEYDEPESIKITADKDFMIVDATLEINEFEEINGVHIPDRNVETIGGLIISSLGRIPKKGERIIINDFEFNVLEATDRKVEKVAIKRLTTKQAGDSK